MRRSEPGLVLTQRIALVAKRQLTPRLTTRLSLVIPAFNEVSVIQTAIAEAEAALSNVFTDFEVLIVDDGSTDATADAVRASLPISPHTRLLRHPSNCGYGAALRTGFEAATYDLIAFTDADCQFDLSDLAPLAALASEHSIVTGYRKDRKDPWKRRFFSWGYNVLARQLLGTRVRDCDCALKVFRREALGQILPSSRGYFVNTEMFTRARQLQLSVAELPVKHRPRLSGESKVSLLEIPRTARKLFSYWWHNVVFGPPTTATVPVTATRKAA